jgi:hypothetical protein
MNWTSLWSLLGYIAAAGAGITLIVAAALGQPFEARYFAWGAWGVASTAIAWISGAVAQPRILGTKPLILGADVTRIPMIPWLIIAGLFVAAVVVSFITF